MVKKTNEFDEAAAREAARRLVAGPTFLDAYNDCFVRGARWHSERGQTERLEEDKKNQDELIRERDALKAEVVRLRKALEFYANENNWVETRKDRLHTAKTTIIGDPRNYGAGDGTLLVIGGKAAEEALKGEGEDK
jgi:hypothetical protein